MHLSVLPCGHDLATDPGLTDPGVQVLKSNLYSWNSLCISRGRWSGLFPENELREVESLGHPFWKFLILYILKDFNTLYMWSSYVSEMLWAFTFLVQKMRAWVQYSIGAFCSFLQLLVSHGNKCQGDSGKKHGHDFCPGGTETGVRAGQTDAMDSGNNRTTAWVYWLLPAVSRALST